MTTQALSVLDVGCGSGAIGLALLNKLPEARCVAIDISEEAVALATENAALVGVGSRYTALHVPGGIAAFASTTPFDVIVSNPPYIPALAAWPQSPSWAAAAAQHGTARHSTARHSTARQACRWPATA